MSANLPTQADIFLKALESVNAARNSLSEARDWLNSDWSPVGSALPGQAGPARTTARQRIAVSKGQIDEAKAALYRALDEIEAAGGVR
ncbi:hypothetical protein JK358_34245 [Nocardia sp. 2]|uniref:Uncharacterized protein n=1 Tax=Nocardia acididurans TaxID=2802282 RepID=A0ABS1MIH2_9NOCA|nr:hypothetical protein [Nocardia acididurans]MBL1079479.1 hypothetical protein [Nocardia acididurans]